MSQQPPSHQIQDEGSLHKYGTYLPNTVVRGNKSRHLSIYAKWLYVYLKSVTGENGVCYRSTTTIAQEAGMSRGQVSAAKKELVTYGLITVRTGKNPKRDADHIRIRDIWPGNMQEFSVHNVNSDEDAQGEHAEQESSSRVHIMNTEDSQSSPHEHQARLDEHLSGPSHENDVLPNNDAMKPVQSSQYELGVHIAAQKKIPLRSKTQEEKPPPPLTPPPGDTAGLRSFERVFTGDGAIEAMAHQVLTHLNALTGMAFNVTTLIAERLREGRTVAECCLVLDWLHTVRRAENPGWVTRCLDNDTPFKAGHFDKYHARAVAWHAQGRPAPRASPNGASPLSEKGQRSAAAMQRILDRSQPSGPSRPAGLFDRPQHDG